MSMKRFISLALSIIVCTLCITSVNAAIVLLVPDEIAAVISCGGAEVDFENISWTCSEHPNTGCSIWGGYYSTYSGSTYVGTHLHYIYHTYNNTFDWVCPYDTSVASSGHTHG